MAARQAPKTRVPKEIRVRKLQNKLKSVGHEWYQLGFQLSIPLDQLKKIEAIDRKGPRACFTRVIEHFLKYNGTWEVLFEALEENNFGRVKSELEDNYGHLSKQKVDVEAKDLVNSLQDVIPQWYMFGQDLDIDPSILQEFKDGKGVDVCFSEMLSVWLAGGRAYWEDLVEALKQIHNVRLANQIELEYVNPSKEAAVKVIPEIPLWYINIEDGILNEEDHFFEVLTAISGVIKWEELGLALGLGSNKLEEVKRDNREQIAECRKGIIRLWLRNGTATWQNLCKALDHGVVGESNLARRLAKEHYQQNQALYVEPPPQGQYSRSEEATSMEYSTASSQYPLYSSQSSAISSGGTSTGTSCTEESGSQSSYIVYSKGKLQFDDPMEHSGQQQQQWQQGNNNQNECKSSESEQNVLSEGYRSFVVSGNKPPAIATKLPQSMDTTDVQRGTYTPPSGPQQPSLHSSEWDQSLSTNVNSPITAESLGIQNTSQVTGQAGNPSFAGQHQSTQGSCGYDTSAHVPSSAQMHGSEQHSLHSNGRDQSLNSPVMAAGSVGIQQRVTGQASNPPFNDQQSTELSYRYYMSGQAPASAQMHGNDVQ